MEKYKVTLTADERCELEQLVRKGKAAARKLARELDIDPEQVTGSGPGGRVTRQDVEAFREEIERLREPLSGEVRRRQMSLLGDPADRTPKKRRRKS